ncbi:MAG TPA: DUF2079 domain-containing protein [Polyangiales bacterium]|nr:DUF2079 domain-containing protein [Polyangiales bacterium]
MKLGTRIAVWTCSAAFSALTAIESLSRYASYHNHTYDLALYARQAWGLAHGDFYEPIVGAPFLGTHIALVLWPLGLLGRLFGTVPVLLVAQSLAFGLATLPLAQIGARRFGDFGGAIATLAWLAYPNLGHVASYEFHPGSLGVLPLALALDALDRHDGLTLLLSVLGLLCCRSDFALLALLLGLMSWRMAPELRLAGRAVTGLALAYLFLQAVWLRHYLPAHGSLELHFATWGGSPFGIVRALFSDPARVVAHFSQRDRLLYLPTVLLPLAFLPLRSLRWTLPALPFFAINLISTFPTATALYSHYLTLAVPPLVVASLDGVYKLSRAGARPRLAAALLCVLCAAALASSVRKGGQPWSRDFVRSDFLRDPHSDECARTVAAIPPNASVQAPDALLPHLAERPRLFRAPPPDRGADYVVLDVSHRLRFAHEETLLRTTEEPGVRNWLARQDYGLAYAEPSLLTLARGNDPRSGLASRYFLSGQGGHYGRRLCECLLVVDAWLDPDGLELVLYARPPCPNDLALRLGATAKPTRVDLMFDGWLSPSQLHEEYLMSFHPLDPKERAELVAHGLHLGALRSSGAPPEPKDPVSIEMPLVH